MRRHLLAATLGLAVAAAPAAAQDALHIHRPGGDTAVAFVPGDTGIMDVYWSSCCYQLQQVRVRLVFDTTLMSVVGVAPGSPFANIQVTPAANGVTVRGNGFLPSGYNQRLFPLRVVLKPAAASGLYLHTQVDSLDLQFLGQDPRHGAGTIGRVCHATDRYGDVDSDTRVDSRDALITLSAAVGLPVTGFQLARGDVDGDGLANSRDALMMLSWSIQLPITTPHRIGSGVPDACPGLTPPGEDLVFAGDTAPGFPGLRFLAGASTTPVTVPVVSPGVSGHGNPRLAPNGTSIAYECYAGFSPQICRVETDGTGFQQLTTGAIYAAFPDWDPTGTKIAYGASPGGASFIHHMDANGANDSTILGSSGFFTQPRAAWSRTGTQFAFGQSSPSFLYKVNRDGLGLTAVPFSPIPTMSSFDITRWSPADDSLAFTNAYGRGIWAVPAAGGTPVRLVGLDDMGAVFDWGPQGIVFALQSAWPGFQGIWLMTPSGLVQRLTGGYDVAPAFRRNP